MRELNAGLRHLSNRTLYVLFCIFSALIGIKASAQDSSTTSEGPPPKVGIIFSAYSNEGTLPDLSQYGEKFVQFAPMFQGYGFHGLLVPQLRTLGFEVYAVVEPGTADQGKLAPLLASLKLTDRVIDGSSAEALKQLDVIASMVNFNMREEVIEGIEQAVHDGVGIMSIGFFGALNPGNTESLREFLGLDQSPANLRFYEDQISLIPVPPQEFRVGVMVSSSDPFKITGIAGFTGPVDGTPILALPASVDENFCPAFIRNYGKGRMMVMQLPVNMNSAALNLLALRTMGQYALNWCAGRRLDANWHALQVAAAAAQSASSTGSSNPTPEEAAKVAPRIGMILGKISEAPPHFAESSMIGTTYFSNLGNVIGAFEEVGCVTYGIADPGMEEDARLHEFIDADGLGGRMIDITSSADMAKVDVLLSYFNAHMSVELLNAVEQAVKSGKGYFAMGETASDTPEGNAILERLLGLKISPDSIQVLPQAHTGHIVSHPDFTGSPHEPGQAIQFWHIVGYPGEPNGDALMAQDAADAKVLPGFTRRVGDGRVMVLQAWSAYAPNSGPASFLEGENLAYLNEAINWASAKPIASTWTPITKSLP